MGKGAAIRSRLGHPVIDADGHWQEFYPALLDALRHVGGQSAVDGFLRAIRGDRFAAYGWYALSPEERRERRATRPAWWGIPTRNTRDRATALFPKLLYERLPEIGIDFSVVYPSIGMVGPHIEDEEVRRACCRAFNRFHAEVFREFAERMTPVAVIPMHTPDEAIEELEFAVRGLGFKAVMLAGFVERPIPVLARIDPEAARQAPWIDTFGLDSQYDYDPVWRKCQELRVSPAFHSHGMGFTGRRSISSYVYNHIGAFAAAHEPLCRALFLGGVTRRFPGLRFAFLEGGVAWAASVYADLIDHWEKRNAKSLVNLDPAQLDRPALMEYARRYGGKLVEPYLTGADPAAMLIGAVGSQPEDPGLLDEFAACQIERREDIQELFVKPFYFGCESDSPTTAMAFTRANPFEARLGAMFSSDIAHWDVPEMAAVVEEAYEHVEGERLDLEDLKDFLFRNAVRFYTATNPDFFEGTAMSAFARSL